MFHNPKCIVRPGPLLMAAVDFQSELHMCNSPKRVLDPKFLSVLCCPWSCVLHTQFAICWSWVHSPLTAHLYCTVPGCRKKNIIQYVFHNNDIWMMHITFFICTNSAYLQTVFMLIYWFVFARLFWDIDEIFYSWSCSLVVCDLSAWVIMWCIYYKNNFPL